MPLGDDAVEIARVVRAHGLTGRLLVQTSDEDAGDLLRAPRVLLDAEPGVIPYRVDEARPLGIHGRGIQVLLSLRGLDSRERARPWVGAGVRIERTLLPPAETALRASELLGLVCQTLDGERLGIVAEIWPTPTCDQLLIRDGEGGFFVPVRDSVPLEVDREAGTIRVDPEAIGLDDADDEG